MIVIVVAVVGRPGESGSDDGRGEVKMERRAVARVVLPEEVGPERARRRGGGRLVGWVGCVGEGLAGGGVEDVGLESLEVDMVGKRGWWKFRFEIGGTRD